MRVHDSNAYASLIIGHVEVIGRRRYRAACKSALARVQVSETRRRDSPPGALSSAYPRRSAQAARRSSAASSGVNLPANVGGLPDRQRVLQYCLLRLLVLVVVPHVRRFYNVRALQTLNQRNQIDKSVMQLPSRDEADQWPVGTAGSDAGACRPRPRSGSDG